MNTPPVTRSAIAAARLREKVLLKQGKPVPQWITELARSKVQRLPSTTEEPAIENTET